MRGNELLDKMELVDEAYIEAAETVTGREKRNWIKYGSVAACFCMLFVGIFTVSRLWGNEKQTPPCPNPTTIPSLTKDDENKGNDPVDQPIDVPIPVLHEFYYNEAAPVAVDRRYVPGYFEEEMSEREMLSVVPEGEADWMYHTGIAGFDGQGRLMEVRLILSTGHPSGNVLVTISESKLVCRYAAWSSYGEAETVTSVCNGVEYVVYQGQMEDGEKTALEATARIGDCYFVFDMEINTEDAEQAKQEFEQVLCGFSRYEEGKPELSAVIPEAVPEYFDYEVSMAEARELPIFGAYLLQNVPESYKEESIRRYKDSRYDYLSGTWSKGYSDLRWKVLSYEEADAFRLTNVADVERYDLSLYPIPRAESVPGELREIVDNPIFEIEDLTLEAVYKRAYKVEDESDEWRMAFSVKYGDIIVEVRTEGVEPEWLYEELKGIQ